MRKNSLYLSIIFIITLCLFAFTVVYFQPEIIEKEKIIKTPMLYDVVSVIDGDTIQVEFNNNIENVRLLGIDTPEIASPYSEEECFGQEAKEYLKRLLENKEVYLIPDRQSSDQDKYGRLLRYVFLPDGLFVGAELIKNGYAYNYIYEPFEFMKYFDFLEKEARSGESGLWGECE
ncbi:thermonuclease family protein [Candidatus Parcubacteria bacterium]|nr:thermonuclease family protein [Patescibacteria group bacterium]MCG2697737.1 thermonuclease family protein [Candidatus Parcubacteria bacterium]